MPINELRVALRIEDYDRAVAFYRDALGLPVIESWDEPHGRGVILDGGHATLELLSSDQVDRVDTIEVGREGVSGPVRLAIEVADSEATARTLIDAGGRRLGGPVVTPWNHRNVRVEAPDGMQLTLFTLVDPEVQPP